MVRLERQTLYHGLSRQPDRLARRPGDFFTFRPGQPDYVDGPTRNDQWGWLEVYPQHGYVKSPDGDFEQVAVGIAQNTSPDRKGHCGAFNVKDAYGRNFSVRNGFDPCTAGTSTSSGNALTSSIRSWSS